MATMNPIVDLFCVFIIQDIYIVFILYRWDPKSVPTRIHNNLTVPLKPINLPNSKTVFHVGLPS